MFLIRLFGGAYGTAGVGIRAAGARAPALIRASVQRNRRLEKDKEILNFRAYTIVIRAVQLYNENCT